MLTPCFRLNANPFSFCYLLLQAAIHPHTAGCTKLSPRQKGPSARAEQLLGGCGLEISMWILSGVFFFSFRNGNCLLLEPTNLAEQAQQHKAGCTTPVCAHHVPLPPNILLWPSKDRRIRDWKGTVREENTRLVSSLWEISSEPLCTKWHGFNSPVRSRKSFVKGSTVGDLEQQKG